MKQLLCIVALCCTCGLGQASEVSGTLLVGTILARETGRHVVFLRNLSGGPADIPAQGCTNNDRVVIDETTPGGKTMIQFALTAYTLGSRVSMKVDGCMSFNPEEPALTAPRVIRFAIGA